MRRRRPRAESSSPIRPKRSRRRERSSPSATARWDEDGEKRARSTSSEGDEVLYSKYGGTEITVEDEDLLVMRESDVLAKLG